LGVQSPQKWKEWDKEEREDEGIFGASEEEEEEQKLTLQYRPALTEFANFLVEGVITLPFCLRCFIVQQTVCCNRMCFQCAAKYMD
jgi:hypothetical protein